jgi:NAD(P)-dependent dehydrogenase (short-subunit alcohol dehydrogenase family)
LNWRGSFFSAATKQDRDLTDVTREIEINFGGPVRMVQQFLPHLRSRQDAAIVNTSSGLAFIPYPLSPIYCATKAAIHSFSQSLRVQLVGTSVTVIELAPPTPETPLLRGEFQEEMKDQKGMPPSVLAGRAIAGIEAGKLEIRPGIAHALYAMSRIAPHFALNQIARMTRWRTPSSRDRIQVASASTEEPLASVPEARPEDVDAAVDAARLAFDAPEGWASWEPQRRADAMERLAVALDARGPEIARLVSAQNGAPSHSQPTSKVRSRPCCCDITPGSPPTDWLTRLGVACSAARRKSADSRSASSGRLSRGMRRNTANFIAFKGLDSVERAGVERVDAAALFHGSITRATMSGAGTRRSGKSARPRSNARCLWTLLGELALHRLRRDRRSSATRCSLQIARQFLPEDAAKGCLQRFMLAVNVLSQRSVDEGLIVAPAAGMSLLSEPPQDVVV